MSSPTPAKTRPSRRAAVCIEEREEILRGLGRGNSLSAVARKLGRCTSTVSREVGANGGRDGYRVWPAHQGARERARRPKTEKLSYAPLAERVSGDLEKLGSPGRSTKHGPLDGRL
ncbi:MAG: helix-turn-helix domain-containing protein [Actinomycetota bacterium]|nr:helix-turn-helix domain-containing protein [Actinomycetota bacterium]